MRRPRSHGSLSLAARLTVACGLATILGAAAATTASAGLLSGLPVKVSLPPLPLLQAPASSTTSSGGSALQLNLGGLSLQVLPTPTPGAGSGLPPPSPPPVVVTLPPVVGVCLTPPCSSTPGAPVGNGTPTTNPPPPGGGSGSATPPRAAGTARSVDSFPLAAPSSGSSNTSASVIPALRDTPPLPVQTLSAVPGISFGQAPYLWPLFLLLDAVAAVAVVLVVRKTWSASTAD